MYNDIRLEKSLYNLSGKSFTAALEELDPSSEYAGTPLGSLDAFERQLKRFNIRIKGKDCDCVEKFFSTAETAVLFPEFVARSIKKGFEDNVLSSLCAAKTACSSTKYVGCTLTDSGEYSTTEEAGELPAATVREDEEPTVLGKYGRLISASYESIRSQRLDVFGVMLRSVGMKLAASVVGEAVSVLIEDADEITAASLNYAALASLYSQFDCFDMTTVVASPAMASQIVAMDQLKDCSANADGRFVLPFGAELVKTAAAGNSRIIGVDRDFALEFITSTDLVIEADKLIDRQLDQTTVSITCGFKKITPSAVKVLKITG